MTFYKISANSTIFEVSSRLSLKFQVSVLEFLMKSRYQSFNQVSVLKVTVSTYITGNPAISQALSFKNSIPP